MQLEKLLKNRKMTQVYLADRLDIPANTISRWINGRHTPSVEMLQRIASFFNVTIDELLRGQQLTEWKINIIWEVDEMNALEIRPDEFTVGFNGSGDIILWGSIPAGKTLEEATERIRDEIAAAMAGRKAYEASKFKEPTERMNDEIAAMAERKSANKFRKRRGQ